MKAIGNNIIISLKKTGLSRTDGGLLLAEKDKENIRYKEAVIVSISDDIKSLNVGDVFPQHLIKQFLLREQYLL